MDYEGFKLKSFIFQKRHLLEKKHFSLPGDCDEVYDFMIDVVGHNALDISTFSKYGDIARRSNRMEKDLHYLISYNAKLASTLAIEAAEKAYKLYDERIDININNVDYTFKIETYLSDAIFKNGRFV